MKKVVVLVAAVGLLLAAGCRSGQGGGTLPSLQAVTLSISATTGTSGLDFDLRITNSGTSPVTLSFASSQAYDIEVTDPLRRPIWTWSYGLAFFDVLWGLSLEPGESKVFDVSWNLTDNDGKRVAPGSYRAKAVITSSPRDPGLTAMITVVTP